MTSPITSSMSQLQKQRIPTQYDNEVNLPCHATEKRCDIATGKKQNGWRQENKSTVKKVTGNPFFYCTLQLALLSTSFRPQTWMTKRTRRFQKKTILRAHWHRYTLVTFSVAPEWNWFPSSTCFPFGCVLCFCLENRETFLKAWKRYQCSVWEHEGKKVKEGNQN